MKGGLILPFLFVVGVLAQAPAAPAPTTPPLSRGTQMALQTLAVELQQVNKDFAVADALVKKEMPGYHLSQQTLQPEKDVVAEKVEPKK